MSVEAMRQALEALAQFASDESDEGQVAIAAHEELRQAIEQAEKQEPVAWVHLHEWKSGEVWPDDCFAPIECTGMTPLYTAPPQRDWVGLTDEEIDYFASFTPCNSFARVIEAKLKKKNHETKQYKDLCGND